MRPLASTGWVEIVAPSCTGHPGIAFRLAAVAAVRALSAAKPLPPLSCRYFGQAPPSADAGTAVPRATTPRPSAARRRSRVCDARRIAALVAIDAVGIEIAAGVSLIDDAAEDGGRPEDHGLLWIGDRSLEDDRAIGARHQRGEGPVPDGHHA